MSRQQFILQPAPHPARANALEAVRRAPAGCVVEIKPKTRTLEQNALMWSMLGEIAQQMPWQIPGNPDPVYLTSDEWKDVFTAALRRQKTVMGIDGGIVVLGQRTSTMTVKEMTDLIELMNAFAAERGVVFSWEVPPPPMIDRGVVLEGEFREIGDLPEIPAPWEVPF